MATTTEDYDSGLSTSAVSINQRGSGADLETDLGGSGAGVSEAPSKEWSVDASRADIRTDDRFLVTEVQCKEPQDAGTKTVKGVVVAANFWNPIVWIYGAAKTTLVEQGKVGLSMNNGIPELLAPGWHFLGSPFRSCGQQVPIRSDIHHGTIHVVTVKEGHLGLAFDRGLPILLGPGMHQWNSPTMIYENSFDLSQPVVNIGPYTYLIVKDGTVAVTYDKGKLDIRSSGYHILLHERHQYTGELLITDQFDELNSLNLITSDKVSLRLDCTVHYKINDARSAALKAGNMRAIRRLVEREAVAAMTSTVAKSRVDDVGLMADDSAAAPPVYGAKDDHKGKGEKAYQGPQHERESLIRSATRTLANIGVQLIKIAVRRIEITDQEIAQKLANQAVIRTNRMEKLDTADVEKQTVEIKAEADASARVIAARAAADEMEILANAKLVEARKLAEVSELLKPNSTGGQLALLQSVGEALGRGNSNTVFVNDGRIVDSLISNPEFTQRGGSSS